MMNILFMRHYFIGADIPEYDTHTIWFVRSIRGSWFSLDIESDWQSGELLVNEEIMNCIDYTINGKNYSRFDIIQKAKEKLKVSTNITDEEQKVLDTLLFRIWQMGWLPESLLEEE